VRVRDPLGCMGRYPHEFSGGMRQRIMLASVMLLRPRLLIADEPTTALDCVVQKDVLDVMMNLTREEGTALVFISHNLALVAAYTEKVLVMRAGLAVETGPVTRVLSRPAHDYTLNLLDALPRRMPDKPSATEDAEATGKSTVLELRQLVIEYSVVGPWFSKRVTRVVHGVSLKVRAGETVAIVGESGSGKTSLTKAILGLLKLTDGDVLLQGKSYLHGGRENLRAARRSIQMIFQDPYSSLDPRMRVASLVGEALRSDTTLSAMERRARVVTSLEDVGLDGYAERFVHELSGGQRQRVAIARALASRPALIIADEPVSALDVTVQKQVLDMLTSLQARYGFGCLLISHDLGVVEQIADSVIVMLRGHIVEEGTRDALFDNPRHPYTQRLLQAVPELRGDRGNGFHVLTRTIPAADPEALIEYFNPELATGGLAHSSLVDVTPGGPFHRIALV